MKGIQQNRSMHRLASIAILKRYRYWGYDTEYRDTEVGDTAILRLCDHRAIVPQFFCQQQSGAHPAKYFLEKKLNIILLYGIIKGFLKLYCYFCTLCIDICQ